MGKLRSPLQKQAGVRFPDVTLVRLGALAGPLSTEVHRANASDVLRYVVELGLPIAERTHGITPAAAMADPMASPKGERGKNRKGGGK